MNRIVAWLCEEAAAETRRPASPPADGTLEGRLREEFREARAHMIREAVHCVRVLARAAPPDVARLAAFLDDPADELVVEMLAAFAAWQTAEVMPDLLSLYRSLERSDPPRPAVADALRACLHAVAGRAFASADELAAWLGNDRCAA